MAADRTREGPAAGRESHGHRDLPARRFRQSGLVQRALYTDKLGFEVRWLTVGPKAQPDLNILLAEPKPPMFAKGAIAGGVIDKERPYGIEALFRDDSGNWFSLRQVPRS